MRRLALLATLAGACAAPTPPAPVVPTTVPTTSTTTTTVAATSTTHTHAPRAARRRAASVASVAAETAVVASGDVLACIRRYESGGNYSAVSRSGRHRGAYQFDRQTWAANGGTGDPATASPEEQDRVAATLLSRRGLQPWPTPARRCA